MRKVREILRLALHCKMKQRKIARRCATSHVTVGAYIKRAKVAGLTYGQIEQMDDFKLQALVKGENSQGGEDRNNRAMPDWSWVHQEMKKKGVTLQLLWQEYKEVHPTGYQLSQFYEYYSRWKKKLNVTLRQTHKAGEKMFIDYAGQTVPVVDPATGEVKEAQVFIAVLGASNYTFAEATWDQSLTSWIGSHIRAFEYFSGVTEILVPDNLRTGVSKSCRYEPDVNPTYQEMAIHYGTVVIPTRVRKPRDKAKAEVGVQIAERWILAALRNRTFFSLLELNEAIRQLLDKLNRRPFKKLEGSRLTLFGKIEKDALIPLPQSRYELAEWKKASVNIDYHVELNRHYYSVPYQLVGQTVYIRSTATVVEIFCRGKRVASHRRDDRPGTHTCQREHMPKSHQQYLEWTPSRMIRWAGTIGECTAQVVETIMKTRRHPELGYRSCLGILRMARHFSSDRLEKACRRAIAIEAYSYKSIRSILEKGLDQQPLAGSKKQFKIVHENLRGHYYYTDQQQGGEKSC